MVYPHEFCPSGFAKNLHLSDSISAKILAPDRLSDFSVHNKNRKRKSSINNQGCMQKQEDQSTRKNQSGVTTEPVSINRKETLQ
jgi:hypothetical protein